MTKWTYAFAINTINLLWRCYYRNTTRLTPKDLRRKKTGTFMQLLVMDAQRCLFLRQSEPLPEQLLLWRFDRILGKIKNAGRQLICLKALVNLSNDKQKTARAQSARASTLFSLDIENVPDFQTENKSEKTQIC